MKTINEVIDLFDKGCIRPCVECPCYGMKECQEQLIAESYYLHKYQEIEDEYDELKDWWAEEHAENVPLTWDELKRMNGKPVWVEGQYPHSWCIVREVQKYMDGTEEIVLDGLNCKIGIGRKEKYGTGWQAYRKERE